MKHLILNDNDTTLMVYFRPKDKVKLYETLVRSSVEYWHEEKPKNTIAEHTIKILNLNGFKVVDISQETKDTLNLRCDFSDDYFTYRNITIWFDPYGLHYRHKGRLTTCKSIEEAINLIDKELD